MCQEKLNIRICKLNGDIKLSDKIQPIKKDSKENNDVSNTSMQEALKKEDK